MTNKRKILFLIISILTVVIVGCSSSNTSSEGNTPTSSASVAVNSENVDTKTPTEVAELKFWDMVWGPPEYIERAKKLVDQFNSEHPGIKVTYQSTPWTNWYQTFSTAIASRTAPDISSGAAYQAFNFYDMDEILPLDDVIDQWKKEGKLDDFFPGSVDALKYKDHYVALPWQIDIRVPFYRKDLFEKAGVSVPKTWDELRAAAKKLTGNGKYGMVLPADTGGTQYLLALMLNNGGGIFTTDKKVDFMNERNVQAIDFLTSMVKDGSINPAGAGFTSDDALKSFSQGDAAMIIRNPQFGDDLIDKVGVIEPLDSANGGKGTVSWVNNLMIYKQTKHPEAAKEFLKWWSENNLPLWSEGHMPNLPARISQSKDASIQNNSMLKKILETYIPIAKTTGANTSSAFPQLNEIEGEGLLQTLTQDIILGKGGKASMEKADKKIKEIMGEK
jgi:multiple sugar transport system substrate-binding protein